MKKVIFWGTFCVLILAAILLAYWPINNPAENYLNNITIAPDQEEYQRHYQLGLLYEEKADWDNARAHYEEAAVATQPEVAEAARESLSDVLQKKADWKLEWQLWLKSLFGLPTVLITVPIMALIIWLAWWLINKIEQKAGYLLMPVDDYTKNGLGQGIHLQISWVLQEVQHVHQQTNETLLTKLDDIAFPTIGVLRSHSEMTSAAFELVDSLSVGGVDVNLGPLLTLVKRWLGSKEYLIIGQLSQRGKQLQLRTEIKRTKTGQSDHIWYISGDTDTSSDEQVNQIIEEFAYRFLVLTAQKKVGTDSWRSLCAFTYGLRAGQRYNITPDEVKWLQQAILFFQEALRYDPDYVTAQYALGTVYNSIGEYEAAEKVFRQVQSSGKLELEATYNLGLSLYHQFSGKWTREKAIAEFKKVVDTIDRRTTDEQERLLLALTYCGMVMVAALETNLKPVDWSFEPSAGRMELVQQYTTWAANLAQGLAVELQEAVQAAAQHALGEAHSQQKNTAKARKALHQALELRPGYPLPYVSMAMTYPKNSDDRLEWLNKAVKIQPGFGYGYLEIGKIYDRRSKDSLKQGKQQAAQEAREAARQAFKNAPHFSDARNKLGEYLIKDGDYEGAMKEFQTAVELNSYNKRAWDNMTWRTLQAMEQGAIPKDEPNIQDAIRWGRHYFDLTEGGAYEWKARDLLGWALLEQGRLDAAEQELQKSTGLEAGKEQLQNRYHLARVYQAKGNFEQARQELKTGLGFGGSRPIQEKAKSLLNELEYQSH